MTSARDISEGETASTQTEAHRDGRTSRPNTDIYLVGAGVIFPEHLTVETIEILSKCKRICTNLPEAMLQGLPQDLREKCVSLWSLYQDGRIRTDNYLDVFHAIVELVEIERPVAWLTPGHPVIFDSVSASLINEGNARGWNLRIIPGISSIDTMLATLGYDPAHGMLIHEATGLVRRRIPVSPSMALMLFQPAVFDVNVAIISVSSAGPDLSPLRDYLREFHSGEHMCAFIRSASQLGEQDLVTWTKLGDLASVPYDLVAGSTLFVPPA
jgi:precorrin-3B methylase